MIFLRFHDARLSRYSYLVGSQGQAVVIDPQRDVELYMQTALAHELELTRVVETHLHSDFVSGARELARRTGARLYLSGEGAPYAFVKEATPLRDGDVVEVGSLLLKAVHTPGHTPEHLALILSDPHHPVGCFIGDLLGSPESCEPECLQQLHGSLEILKAMPDYVELWPGTEAGCLGAVGATVGYQKLTKAAWSQTGWKPPAAYQVAAIRALNQAGPPPNVRELPPQLGHALVERAMRAALPVVDVRHSAAYAHSHLEGVRHIPLDNKFCRWGACLLPAESPFYLIADTPAQAHEAAYEFTRVGLDRCEGWAPARLFGNTKAVAYLEAADLIRSLARDRFTLLDVRSAAEHEQGHVPGSLNVPLEELRAHLDDVPRGVALVIYGAHDEERALIAASLLEHRCQAPLSVVSGGYLAWCAAQNALEPAGR